MAFNRREYANQYVKSSCVYYLFMVHTNLIGKKAENCRRNTFIVSFSKIISLSFKIIKNEVFKWSLVHVMKVHDKEERGTRGT